MAHTLRPLSVVQIYKCYQTLFFSLIIFQNKKVLNHRFYKNIFTFKCSVLIDCLVANTRELSNVAQIMPCYYQPRDYTLYLSLQISMFF